MEWNSAMPTRLQKAALKDKNKKNLIVFFGDVFEFNKRACSSMYLINTWNFGDYFNNVSVYNYVIWIGHIWIYVGT